MIHELQGILCYSRSIQNGFNFLCTCELQVVSCELRQVFLTIVHDHTRIGGLKVKIPELDTIMIVIQLSNIFWNFLSSVTSKFSHVYTFWKRL